MTKQIKRSIVLIAFTLVTVFSVKAQGFDNTAISAGERFKPEYYSEIDDYKRSHFNQSIHDLGNERIVADRECVSFNHNYKQQAGSQDPAGYRGVTLNEYIVEEDDPVVLERNYKQLSRH